VPSTRMAPSMHTRRAVSRPVRSGTASA
jgi:hypothetical protein